MSTASSCHVAPALPTVFTVRDDGVKERVVCCGGVYSNVHALGAFLARCDAAGVARDALYCLGDLTGFGPQPVRTLELLRASGIHVLQGNHDFSMAHNAGGCGCGYTEGSGDAYWSQLSFDYTVRETPAAWHPWLAALPHQVDLRLADGRRVRLCHGSPRVMNEFLFESLPDDFYRARLAEVGADIIVCTHTGLPWTREVAPGKWIVNCGVLGRPANDGARMSGLRSCGRAKIRNCSGSTTTGRRRWPRWKRRGCRRNLSRRSAKAGGRAVTKSCRRPKKRGANTRWVGTRGKAFCVRDRGRGRPADSADFRRGGRGFWAGGRCGGVTACGAAGRGRGVVATGCPAPRGATGGRPARPRGCAGCG